MHRRVQVITTRKPGRDLRIRALAAQVQHQMPRNGERAGMSRERAHDIQHQVQPGGDAGAGVAFTIDHE